MVSGDKVQPTIRSPLYGKPIAKGLIYKELKGVSQSIICIVERFLQGAFFVEGNLWKVHCGGLNTYGKRV